MEEPAATDAAHLT